MALSRAVALLALTAAGAETAARLRPALPGAVLHGRNGRVEGADVGFDDAVAALRRLFETEQAIVAVCATGIAVRALGPLLQDKTAEPPVVVVAEDGSAVVPLLGGHRGANELAAAIAEALAVAPAITTAGDRRWGVALDAPPPTWRLANPSDYKTFAAALLAENEVRLEGEADWLQRASLPWSETAALTICVTEREIAGGPDRLVYHPPVLALGVGCERGADPAELSALVAETLEENGLAEGAIAAVVSLDLKADEPAVQALAAELVVPARFFEAAALEAETPRLANPSEAVFREVGCHGVAEGAALAAAGPGARLIVPKRKSARATCAVALAPAPLDAAALGRRRGRLSVVGLGPGAADWRTPEAEAAVAGAEHLVGYSLYLDLLGRLAEGKARHDYALGEETERVRSALSLAAAGESVALICSGDPGIYAMAALVFEQIEAAEEPAWGRVAVTVAPGISALQAAAARLGAPLGHDFCAISLSDLLTPWAVIEKRLQAAAEGDFVVALYNPISRKRSGHLTRALSILGAARPPETPVAYARNLGREGESLAIRRIDEPVPETVDMLTLVMVGSSETRRVARGDGGAWVYTPRGYAAKRKEDAA